MPKSLLETFSSLDSSITEALADTDSPLLLSFAALDIAESKAGTSRLTAEHIVACLESAGVAVSRKSISRALARAGNRVSTSRDLYGDVQYKLMTRGRREIDTLFGGELLVSRIEAGTPRTARKMLAEILAKLGGVVRVCDPYYGVRTLDTLDHIPNASPIRFLTSKTNESKQQVTSAMYDFTKERPNAEFRIVSDPKALHDRYVLSSKKFLLLGHGLKDIGGRESFLVELSRDIAADLIADVRNTFDARWKAGTSI